LVYDAFVVPQIESLFAALAHPELIAEISELNVDPESGPLRFDHVVRLPHSTPLARFHLATQDDLVCLIWSADEPGGYSCQVARSAATRSYAYELASRSGSIGLRVALIPDTVADDPELRALGVLESNVLVLDKSTTSGKVTVQRPDGGEFILTIP